MKTRCRAWCWNSSSKRRKAETRAKQTQEPKVPAFLHCGLLCRSGQALPGLRNRLRLPDVPVQQGAVHRPARVGMMHQIACAVSVLRARGLTPDGDLPGFRHLCPQRGDGGRLPADLTGVGLHTAVELVLIAHPDVREAEALCRSSRSLYACSRFIPHLRR